MHLSLCARDTERKWERCVWRDLWCDVYTEIVTESPEAIGIAAPVFSHLQEPTPELNEVTVLTKPMSRYSPPFFPLFPFFSFPPLIFLFFQGGKGLLQRPPTEQTNEASSESASHASSDCSDSDSEWVLTRMLAYAGVCWRLQTNEAFSEKQRLRHWMSGYQVYQSRRKATCKCVCPARNSEIFTLKTVSFFISQTFCAISRDPEWQQGRLETWRRCRTLFCSWRDL